MSEPTALEKRSRAAREHVRPVWDESRALHLTERAAARRRRRAIARGATLGIAAAAALVLFYSTGSEPAVAPRAPEIVASSGGAWGVLRFPDGSAVTPLEPDTDVVVDAVRASAIELELVTGAARFEVTTGLPRAFRVQAGRATVSVVGTVFTVRREGEGAVVEVQEGRVHVTWDPGRSTYLSPGERGVFPRPDDPLAVASPELVEPEPERIAREEPPPSPERDVAPAAPRAREGSTPSEDVVAPAVQDDSPEDESPEEEPTPSAIPAWRSLADEGHFDEGYALLLTDRDVLRSDDVEALMQAADCARLSGHARESLAYLHRAADVGREDPRAPMIAFTLGRVLLSQLSSPREAAAEFVRAREMSPTGTLASDALAREVEAWSRAGEPERARTGAEEYLRLYPSGLHAAAVRRFGGLP